MTIQNGAAHCSLRVTAGVGDSILSWGNKLLRFRYEGTWGVKGFARDIMVVKPQGQVIVFGGITSNSYYYRSDARLKDAVEPIQGALEKVMAMQGVSFEIKDMEDVAHEESGIDDDDPFPAGPMEGDREKRQQPRRLGLIAQEVEKIWPEIVATDDDGMKAMDTTQINAILVEAIKDQQKIIQSQQAFIDTQQSRLERIEKAMAKLGFDV